MRVYRKMCLPMEHLFLFFTITNKAEMNIFVHVPLITYKRVFLKKKSRSHIARSYGMIIFKLIRYYQVAF